MLLRLAPEPETKATSFKQDEVGKMEQIAAIILSELLPCLFTQSSPFKVFAPVFFHRHKGANSHRQMPQIFSSLCLPAVALPHWFWALKDVFPAKLDLLVDEPSASSHNRQMDWKWFALYAFFGFKTVLSVKVGFPKIARNLQKNEKRKSGFGKSGFGRTLLVAKMSASLCIPVSSCPYRENVDSQSAS